MPSPKKTTDQSRAHPSKGPNTSLDLYLQDINRLEMVTPEQERALAKRIRAGDTRALNQLVMGHLRFVVTVARSYRGRGLPLADLINEGNQGLLRAARRYDETKGVKFISYAVWWIRQAMQQALAEQTWMVRLPMSRIGLLRKIGKVSKAWAREKGYEPTAKELAEALGTTADHIADTLRSSKRHLSLDASVGEDEETNLLSFLADEKQPSPDEGLLQAALAPVVNAALAFLSPRESEILTLYYGIGVDQALTLEQIGQRFRLTRERIRQIKDKALARLRHPARRQQLDALMETVRD